MTQHDTLTLEPCPFCGALPDDRDVGDYFVSCPSCGIDGPAGLSDGREAAANAWNRRAALSATQPAQAAQSEPTLRDYAEDLVDAGHDFWKACESEAGGGAVRWLSCDDGTLIVFTRIEYRDEIMAHVRGYKAPVVVFDEDGMTALEAEAAQGAGEVVYQIKGDVFQCPHAWRDADEETFHMVPAKDRRIVYTTPSQPAPVVPEGWPAFDQIDDEVIDAACRAGWVYRVDLMRAYNCMRAMLTATPTPPAQAAADARDAFEAEMRCEETWGHRSLKKRLSGQYENWQVDLMWGVWKAALATHQQRQDGGDA